MSRQRQTVARETAGMCVVTIQPAPMVTFTPCNDIITTTDAQAFQLKGGTPLGGTYSGRGVSIGVFNPSLAGPGTDTIVYSFTNLFACSHRDTIVIAVHLPFAFCLWQFTDRCEGQ